MGARCPRRSSGLWTIGEPARQPTMTYPTLESDPALRAQTLSTLLHILDQQTDTIREACNEAEYINDRIFELQTQLADLRLDHVAVKLREREARAIATNTLREAKRFGADEEDLLDAGGAWIDAALAAEEERYR